MTPLLRKTLNPNQNYSYHSPLLHQFQLKCVCEVSDQIESFDFESCLRPSEQSLGLGAMASAFHQKRYVAGLSPEINLFKTYWGDDALGFFKAFHVLLAFLVAFLTAFIGLHFQVLGISPLESHFATVLILIMTTIVYSIAYVEIKLPQNAEYLPILKLICLVSGIVALELLVAIIICPFWLLMVNICPILIVGVLHHSYQQIYQFLYRAANLVLNAVPSLFQKIYQLFYQIYDWFLQIFKSISQAASQAFSSMEQGDNGIEMAEIV